MMTSKIKKSFGSICSVTKLTIKQTAAGSPVFGAHKNWLLISNFVTTRSAFYMLEDARGVFSI